MTKNFQACEFVYRLTGSKQGFYHFYTDFKTRFPKENSNIVPLYIHNSWP